MKSKNKFLLSCPSACDPLGHPEMALSIAYELGLIGNDVKIIAIAKCIQDTRYSNNNICPIYPSFFSKYTFLSESRKITTLARGFLRLYVMIKYYCLLSNLDLINQCQALIDLEYEPISFAIASFLKPSLQSKVALAVVHAFPSPSDQSFTRFYKKISLYLLRRMEQKGVYLGVMTEHSYEYALNYGFKANSLVSVGWGFNEPQSFFKSNKIFPHDISEIDFDNPDTTFLLLFGVMRRNKNILQLINHFASAKSSNIHLILAGKNLDYSISELKSLALNAQGTNKITIIDRYLADSEVDFLASKCHIHVLCHSDGFVSASGPMLYAIKYQKSILCFSTGTIAKSVVNLGIGMTSSLTDIAKTLTVISILSKKTYNQAVFSHFLWKTIAGRINNATYEWIEERAWCA